MPKRDQLRRIIEIDKHVAAGTYPSAHFLSAELGVALRAIYYDRDYMVEIMGAPLALDRKRGGWYYTEPTWTLPSIFVTRGELIAFLLAVEATRTPLGAGLQDELLNAVEKIGQSLHGTVAIDLEALRQHVSFAVPLTATVSPATVLALREATERQRKVAMTYFSAWKRERRRRTVEPHHIYNADGDWYLLAYDRDQQSIRTFLIARIEDLEVQEEGFARQEGFTLEPYTKSGFRAESGPTTYQIEIWFSPQQASYIHEKSWHETQTIQELPDGAVVLRFESSGLKAVVRWVLSYGANAEVLAPPELREMVATAARKMVGIYG